MTIPFNNLTPEQAAAADRILNTPVDKLTGPDRERRTALETGFDKLNRAENDAQRNFLTAKLRNIIRTA